MGLWGSGGLVAATWVAHWGPRAAVLVWSSPQSHASPQGGTDRVAVETACWPVALAGARLRPRGESTGGVPQASQKAARVDSDSIFR